MSAEWNLIEQLRALATHPGARGLADDAAVLEVGGTKLVLTHDALVEGLHFLKDDPPESIAWKLLAVNLSDLAAKGARPVGALMGYTLRGEERHLSLTLIGEAAGPVPSRSGAEPGDMLYVSGPIGNAGAGLKMRLGEMAADDALVRAYLRPEPDLRAGIELAPRVTAMMDVSDGLLIDAARMAAASGVGVHIDLDDVPLSLAYVSRIGDDRAARLAAVTAGDDYVLLFTSHLALREARPGVPVYRIGRVVRGEGISLFDRGEPVKLPLRLGWEHN